MVSSSVKPLPSRWFCVSAILLLTTLALCWQIASPSDLYDNEQPITLSHFMDVALNGHLLSQFNPFEGLSTKPPAYHWLGGVMVQTLGTQAQWHLKFPSILCFLITIGLIAALAGTCLNPQASLLAAAIWIANFHVLKLAYTARPDMMLAMFMTLGLLALQYQRSHWHAQAGEKRVWTYWLWLVVLWGAVVMAVLTKGPPALLVTAIVAIMLWNDRRLWSRDSWPHLLGLLAVAVICGGWLWLAMHYYPQWHQVLDKEVWSRLAGASHPKIYPSRWNELLYFLARFIPWSFLTIAAMIILPWWRRPTSATTLPAPSVSPASAGSPSASGHWLLDRTPASAGVLSWAGWWLIVVLGILALPKGRRADHILPVYAGSSVLVAALACWAQSGHKASRVMTHVLLGGILIAGLVAAVSAYWLPRPGLMTWAIANITPVHTATYSSFILTTTAVAAGLAGLTGLCWLHKRYYYHAGFAACLCMVAIVGMYGTTYSRAAKNRNGDYVAAIARTASLIKTREHRTPMFYQTGYVPVQPMMGYHQQIKDYQPVEPAGSPVILITSTQGWSTLVAAGAKGQILLKTPWLPESSNELMLVRPTFLPQSVQESNPPDNAQNRSLHRDDD